MSPAILSLSAALLGQQIGAEDLLGGRAFGWAAFGPLWGALATGVVALVLLLPRSTRNRRRAGAVLGFLSLLLLLAGVMAPLPGVSSQVVFWTLAAVTLVSAVAAIATPSPIYTAVWFALSLLGTAGLLLFQGAQFLSVATIAVYAGAIVVTFIFVIMLAQPQGTETYDRVSWSVYAKPVSAVIAALLVGILSFAIRAVSAPSSAGDGPGDVLQPAHMARFGRELFGKHLLSIEIAGALLLVALVGAVVIMIQAGELGIESEEGPSDE